MSQKRKTLSTKAGAYLMRVHAPEYCEAEYAVVVLKRRHIDMVSAARTALRRLAGRFSGWGSITLRGTLSMMVLRCLDDDRIPMLFGGLKALPDVDAVRIGDDFDFNVPDNDEVWRSDCHGLKIYDDSVYAVATDHYSSDEVESCDLSDLMSTPKKLCSKKRRSQQ